MNTTVLVTGGAGFIGSHVADHLIELGYNVVVLDDLSGGFIQNVNPKTEFIEGSINDVEMINGLFEKFKFKYVFHLAAYAAEGLSHFIKKFNYENNLIGSINLMNASVNVSSVKCFVFTSSIAVYGTNQVPMKEETIPMPEDPYGIAKYAVEMELKESFEFFGLNYIIFRPHNVYGERQNIGDKYRNVIGIFMNQILLNQPMTIFGDEEQARAFSYIDDVAPVIARSIERKECYNKISNVGADTPYTVNTLARTVAKVMGVECNIKYLNARKEVLHAYSSHDQVNKYFKGLIKNISLEEGLKEMADWVKKHGSRESQKFNNIEVSRNLPDSWK